MLQKFKIDLSLNRVVVIDDLIKTANLNLGKQEIISEFEYFLTKHYYQFGTKPYAIEYVPGKGYILRASSDIGKISTNNFELLLKPKFEGLTFGKCLALSQYTNTHLLKINSNELTKNLMSNKFDYSTLDFLGLGLIDAVTSIINNGLARTYEEIISSSNKIKGAIHLISTYQEGKTTINPNIAQIEPDYDINPNRVIKAALTKVKGESSGEEIRRGVAGLLTHFSEVGNLSPADNLDALNFAFNLPRTDYEKAFLFSISILKGGLVTDQGQDIDLPSITLDLDRSFEDFVANTLRKLLSASRFDIYVQKDFPHPISPELTSKKIVPDIIIHDKKFGKTYIIDTKNKYSELSDGKSLSVSNSDIYQIAYYCKALGSSNAILLYPGMSPKLQFPVKSSESDSAYLDKSEKFMDKYNKIQSFEIFAQDKVNLRLYQIDLGGTIYNTEKSLASFCQFISFLSEHE